MVRIGGYIILFSVILNLIPKKAVTYSPALILVFSTLEVTSGVAPICRYFSGTLLLFPAMMFCVSFGGFCALAQTMSVTRDCDLSGREYITRKLATSIVTSLLAFFLQTVLH